eukprot:637825-Pleurochrysis_carterae.AAC.4
MPSQQKHLRKNSFVLGRQPAELALASPERSGMKTTSKMHTIAARVPKMMRMMRSAQSTGWRSSDPSASQLITRKGRRAQKGGEEGEREKAHDASGAEARRMTRVHAQADPILLSVTYLSSQARFLSGAIGDRGGCGNGGGGGSHGRGEGSFRS